MEFTGNRGTTKKSPKIKKTTWFHSFLCHNFGLLLDHRPTTTCRNQPCFVHCHHLTTELTAGKRPVAKLERTVNVLPLLDHKISLTNITSSTVSL